MIYNCDDLEFKIISISKYYHRKGKYKVPARDFAAFSLRISGSASFVCKGVSFVSNVGDIMFLPANAEYEAEYTDGESLVVHLVECTYNDVDFINLSNKRSLTDKFELMYENWKCTQNINRAKSDIYDILYQMSKDSLPTYDKAFSRSLDYLNSHFDDPKLKMSDVLTVGNLSETTLYRRFLNYFEVSPKEYLMKLRLKKAIELLVMGEQSIKEIAFKCGFNDEKYFSRLIRKRFGKSPSALYTFKKQR